MLLYIAKKCKEIGGYNPEEKFFEQAHRHFYGCSPDLRIEVAQYKLGVVSTTMRRYVRHLQFQEAQAFDAQFPTTTVFYEYPVS